MAKIKVAGIQSDIGKDPKENLRRNLEMIDSASEDGASFICLPELFMTGFDYDYIKANSRGIPNKITEVLGEKAKKSGIYILSGSIPEMVGEDIYNTAVLFGRDGKIIGKYSKIHLFGQMGEKSNFTHGGDVRVFDTDFGRIGVTICYDLRFPELFRKQSVMGAKIIFVPSEFPDPKLDHWRTLLKARAIENQIYVMGVNRVGKDEQSTFFGHSMVIGPRGTIMTEASDGEEIISAEIDIGKVGEVRERTFYLGDRRCELY
ncbi:MAG: carbon-nitrogen family hydrolase [Halobacteriota archaeon]|nr:carbon-nitrogen family hydrolase [Halobacteriota archaeon]